MEVPSVVVLFQQVLMEKLAATLPVMQVAMMGTTMGVVLAVMLGNITAM